MDKDMDSRSSPPDPPEPEGVRVDDDEAGSVGDHLDDLRRSLISAISLPLLIIATAWPFWWDYIAPFFSRRLLSEAQQNSLTRLEVFDSFSIAMSMTIQLAIFVSVPWVTWHLWRFIAPGLYKNEKQFARVAMPGAIALFCAGVAFAFYIVIPFSLNFLLNFGTDTIGQQQLTIRSFYSFVFSMLLVNGLCFQLPLVVAPLIRFEVVKPEQIKKHRRMLIFASAVLGAVLTPTGDPATMTIVAVPIYLLIEGGMWLGIVWRRGALRRAAKQPKTVGEGWREGIGRPDGILGEEGAQSFADAVGQFAKEFSAGVKESAGEFKKLADESDQERTPSEAPALNAPSDPRDDGDARESGEDDQPDDPDPPPAAPDPDPQPGPAPSSGGAQPQRESPALSQQARASDSPTDSGDGQSPAPHKPDREPSPSQPETARPEAPQPNQPDQPVTPERSSEQGAINLAPHAPMSMGDEPVAPAMARRVEGDERPTPRLPKELRRRIDAYVRERLHELVDEVLAEREASSPQPEAPSSDPAPSEPRNPDGEHDDHQP